MKVLEKKLVVEEVEQVLDPECVNIEDSQIPNPTSMVPTFDNLTEYSFETDNLALKNNTDYYKLLRTLSILEGQRNLVISNLEKLSELLENSQKNPLEQVDLLKKGEFFSPPRVEITKLPVVDWSKYGVNVPECILEAKPTFSQNETQIKNVNGKMVVRGRVFDESKPVTFNQRWTPEEQRLLEELLEKFPPEPIEYQRCKKIAAAMGNRTARQVLSRVQKYFIKLQKAGLPVPGRKYGYEKYLKRNKKFNAEAQRLRHLFMPSTFWGSSGLTVSMNDDDSSSSSLKENTSEHDLFKTPDQQGTRSEDEISDVSDEEDVPVELRNTPEYEEIQWLKFVMKIEKKQSYLGLVVHDGYKCDNCGVEPIKGTRWQCSQCSEDASVDFCNNCARDRPSIRKHLKSHQLFPIMRLDES